MYKIDLHCHTQITKSGDGIKREIEPNKFIKKMTENDVKLCSITNHNIFDIKEFNEISSNNENKFVIFPGIEIDVNIKGGNRQLIIICDPRKRMNSVVNLKTLILVTMEQSILPNFSQK